MTEGQNRIIAQNLLIQQIIILLYAIYLLDAGITQNEEDKALTVK